MGKIVLSPSLMCADLVNLEKSINDLKEAGLKYLHIDIIDGEFSPSMPLGIETIKRIRQVTDMKLDIHIMSLRNEFFIKEMLKIGVQNITFHIETALHADYLINLIKAENTSCGIALNPATSFQNLEWVIGKVDLLCLMLINPGFANSQGEKQILYANQKLRSLTNYLAQFEHKIELQVDGRVSLDSIPQLIQSGATNLVLGTQSLFRSPYDITGNKKKIDHLIQSEKGD